VVETLRGGDVPRLDIFLEFYTEAATVACSKEARRSDGCPGFDTGKNSAKTRASSRHDRDCKPYVCEHVSG
jgi:hypothetical protein